MKTATDIGNDDSLTPKEKYSELFSIFPTTRAAYRSYVTSGDWRKKRASKLKITGKVCQKCSSRERIEVHHINYRYLFDCTDDDLMVLCQKCHGVFH